MARKDDKIIGFRVDDELYFRLEEVAKREGISTNEWARRVVVRDLQGQNQITKIALHTEAIKQELVEIRKDIAVATEGILVSGGKATNEQASRFVKSNMRGTKC